MAQYKYQYVLVENLGDFVYHVKLNRPKQLNALNMEIWLEIGDVFRKLREDTECRAIVLTGEGRGFTAGLDIKGGALGEMVTVEPGEDIARKARNLRKHIMTMQDQFTDLERCEKPVIAAVHGICFGGGVDLIAACDVRYCAKDSNFSIKMAYTARNFGAEEALKYNLVSRVFETKEDTLREAVKLAKEIATKSPVAVQGTKVVLNYSRDHTVAEGLEYVTTWNQSQLFTEDIPLSGAALVMREPMPPFSKL